MARLGGAEKANTQSAVTIWKQQVLTRVVHGSILCDPIQPNPSAGWLTNPTQPMGNSGFDSAA